MATQLSTGAPVVLAAAVFMTRLRFFARCLWGGIFEDLFAGEGRIQTSRNAAKISATIWRSALKKAAHGVKGDHGY